MVVSLTDLVQWLGYGLYLLGAILLWVYTRDHSKLDARVTDLEKNCPTHDDVTNMVKALLYEDTTRQ